MVDVTDVQGYRTKFENQKDLLESADIDDRDRQEIQRWVAHLRANDSKVESLGTVVGHLNRIRLSAERAHLPLVDMGSVDDINALKLHLEDVHGLGDGTIRNYMKAVSKFFSWYAEDEDWPDAISVGAPPERKHDPDEEITSDELDAMLDATAEFDSSARDKALIALLRDTGLRIGAVLSFQLKHVDFEGRRGTITINEKANVKDADGPKPVTWSRGYVANWLDNHPRPDNPEAALIHKTRQWTEDEHGALRQQYAGERIKEIAEVAGLKPERIHAHLFRGTAISEWIRDQNMNDQTIKNRVDWSPDSREFSTYSCVSDEEFNEKVFDHYGIEGDEEETETSKTLEECTVCRRALRGTEDFCPSCATPLNSMATEKTDAVKDATFESATEADVRNGDYFSAFRERFNNDPEFRRTFVDDADEDVLAELGLLDHDDPSRVSSTD